METWSTHQLYQEAASSQGSEVAARLQAYAGQLIGRNVAVVFTLGHLARITGIDYRVLHDSVNRRREAANYRMYAVAKRSGGRRFIHSVCGDLFRVQQFINQEILQRCQPHPASFAFHPSGGIRKCAEMHCGAKWIFQFDLTNFFYDVTEIDVYRIFHGLGYRPLLAFEFARLCTTTHLPYGLRRLLFHHGKSHLEILEEAPASDSQSKSMPHPDVSRIMGVLPQGAPTSPMLSSLAARKLDDSLATYAADNGFVYTRYADDITISTSNLASPRLIGNIQRNIVRRIRQSGFKENVKKTRVAGPGSKKVVLGLLVDGGTPRLSRETYHRIDRLLHASVKYDLAPTAAHEGFESAYGFYNHIAGLIAFVKDVDQKRWKDFFERFKTINPPWGDDNSSKRNEII
jgi:RNA-directed DNA polymerase